MSAHSDDELTDSGLAEPVNVSLRRTATKPTPDQALWVAIRHHAQAVGFNRYQKFIDCVLCQPPLPPVDPFLPQTRRDAEASPPPQGPQDECREFRNEDGVIIDPKYTYHSPSIEQRRESLIERPTIYGMDAYNLLKVATEAFLIFECGVVEESNDPLDFKKRVSEINEEDEFNRTDRTLQQLRAQLQQYFSTTGITLPYLDRIVRQIVSLDQNRQAERLPYCEAILQHRLTCPSLLELIWSYWHEEGMLVQTMNAIALRFQNRRRGARDPLVNLELDPLRPLNNLLWGFMQDEANRLNVQRRAYEYDHHYGITLVGKAINEFHPADSRSKFVEAFHNLLYRTAMFYRDDDDTTIVADGFALLNALREVHILLAEGAHNQFGDLPWTARKEMLIMQWLLARPEMKEFLRGRYMVPYQEPWMGAVDDMKRLQGWSDVTITHFHELGIYGEQILLSIRYGDWIVVNNQNQARNWARYWRPEIQRYIHAYQAVTGVDLSTEITDTRQAADRFLQPSAHLQNRLAEQRGGYSLPSTGFASGALPSEAFDYAELPRDGYAELPRRPGRRLLRHNRGE